MADKPVGFGLLGAGLVAPFHGKALRASEKAQLVAVADLDEARGGKFGGEFGCAVYRTLDELLANPEVECVNVLTPNAYHFEAVVAAAVAGRHVLVEKPPAMSLRETDRMVETCAQHGVRFGVVLQCRVRKPIQAIKQAIAAGRFGKLLMCSTYMKWFRSEAYYFSDAWRSSRKSGAGVTIQHAFHYLDLCQYLMGPAKRVDARMENLAHPKVELEDTLLARVDWANGALGVVDASTALWPGTDLRVEVSGEYGTAIMVGERMDTWRFGTTVRKTTRSASMAAPQWVPLRPARRTSPSLTTKSSSTTWRIPSGTVTARPSQRTLCGRRWRWRWACTCRPSWDSRWSCRWRAKTESSVEREGAPRLQPRTDTGTLRCARRS